jgi:hypothetical protein
LIQVWNLLVIVPILEGHFYALFLDTVT